MDEHQPIGPQTHGSSEDLDIRLGVQRSRSLEEKAHPLRDRTRSIEPYGKPLCPGVVILLHEKTLRDLELFSSGDLSRETGGVLLGEAYHSGDDVIVEVMDFIHAEKAEGSRMELTFTHDAWERVNAEKERKAPNLSIVGWYHTHPDIGVFLSSQDMFIQRNFFPEPWQVALVLDPVRHDRGVFYWRNAQIEQADGFYVCSSRRESSELRRYIKGLERGVRKKPVHGWTGESDNQSVPRSQHGITGPWQCLILVLLVVVVVQGIYLRSLLAERSAESRPNQIALRYVQLASDCEQAFDYEHAALYLRLAWAKDPENEIVARRLLIILSHVPRERQEPLIAQTLDTAKSIAGTPHGTSTVRIVAGALSKMGLSPDQEQRRKELIAQPAPDKTSSRNEDAKKQGLLGWVKRLVGLDE